MQTKFPGTTCINGKNRRLGHRLGFNAFRNYTVCDLPANCRTTTERRSTTVPRPDGAQNEFSREPAQWEHRWQNQDNGIRETRGFSPLTDVSTGDWITGI